MDQDKAALTSLLTRYINVWDENQNDLGVREWLDRRIGERALVFEKLHSAFSLYGFDTKTDGFMRLTELFGQDAYAQIVAKARTAAQMQPPAPPPALPAKAEQEAPGALEFQPKDGTVRELTIGLLKDAGERGVKAGEIRLKIEALKGHPLHEKTVGMTLYRLSLDGLSRRTGRTWFYVPPGAETKNPAGDTAGQTSIFDE